ncbi:MAG: hypothetical protein AAFU73_16335 [Planctomycetota bacterium]
MTTMTVPIPTQQQVPAEDVVGVVTAHGKHEADGLAAVREEGREENGLLGQALFPTAGTAAVVLVLAVSWFGFVRPRLKRRA